MKILFLDSVDETEIARHFKNGSDVFFQDIEKELQKVNLFFGEKLNEAARRFTQLKNDVELQQKTEGIFLILVNINSFNKLES